MDDVSESNKEKVIDFGDEKEEKVQIASKLEISMNDYDEEDTFNPNALVQVNQMNAVEPASNKTKWDEHEDGQQLLDNFCK